MTQHAQTNCITVNFTTEAKDQITKHFEDKAKDCQGKVADYPGLVEKLRKNKEEIYLSPLLIDLDPTARKIVVDYYGGEIPSHHGVKLTFESS